MHFNDKQTGASFVFYFHPAAVIRKNCKGQVYCCIQRNSWSHPSVHWGIRLPSDIFTGKVAVNWLLSPLGCSDLNSYPAGSQASVYTSSNSGERTSPHPLLSVWEKLSPGFGSVLCDHRGKHQLKWELPNCTWNVGCHFAFKHTSNILIMVKLNM